MDDHPERSPHRIDRPVVTQRWEDVSMLHWRVAPPVVDALLPPGLRADTVDGSAWASLVPFRMAALTAPPIPPLPYMGTFPETNIRTYVVGPDGPAVWFLSLDITRLMGVPVARIGFGQPYIWSRMAIDRRGEEIRYWCRRRFPGPNGARSHVGVRIGGPVAADPLDAFLTNRWAAYSVIRGRLHHAAVVHDPWPLHRAEVTLLHDELGAAGGLSIGRIERVHYAASATGVVFAAPTPCDLG